MVLPLSCASNGASAVGPSYTLSISTFCSVSNSAKDSVCAADEALEPQATIQRVSIRADTITDNAIAVGDSVDQANLKLSDGRLVSYAAR